MDPSEQIYPFKCTLNVVVPTGKESKFKRIISPLMKWIDPSCHIIKTSDENEKFQSIHKQTLVKSSVDCDDNSIRVPAMSIMLFLYEHGTMCAPVVQKYLKKKPWKFHHRVELHSRRTPEQPIAAQEFYGIADDLPLWSVCPVHCGNEHFRILLNVKNFQKMVEFYRVITDVEIESSKPGFCIFQLYSQPGLDIQLALKQAKHIDPCPIDRANLVFRVKNLEAIKSLLQCNSSDTRDTDQHFLRDPDGNLVKLEQDVIFTEDYIALADEFRNRSNLANHQQQLYDRMLQSDTGKVKSESDKYKTTQINNFEDLKSFRSCSDSQDSGRCSDSDIWCSEVEHARSTYRCDKQKYKMGDTNLVPAHSVNKCSRGFKRMQIENGSNFLLTSDFTHNALEFSNLSKRSETPVYI